MRAKEQKPRKKKYVYEDGDLDKLKSFKRYPISQPRRVDMFIMRYVENKSAVEVAKYYNICVARVHQILRIAVRNINCMKKHVSNE